MPAEQLRVEIHYEPQGYLVVKTAGMIDEASLPQLLAASAAAALENRCDRFFVDHRDSSLRLSPVAIYRVPTGLHRHGIIGHRAALVFSAIGEDERFLEIVCANRDVVVKVFTDPIQALAWLMEPTG